MVRYSLLALASLVALAPTFAWAIDGSVDVRGTHQTANRGTETFDTFTRRDVLSVGQRVPLGGRLFFDARFRHVRETAGTESEGDRVETEQWTNQPSVLLAYAARGLRVSANGSWLERRFDAESGPVPDQTRLQFGATVDADPTSTTDLAAVWSRTVTESESGPLPDREIREHSGFASLRQRLVRSWSMDYRYSARATDLVDQDTRQLLQGHLVEVSGSPRVGDRLRTSWRARTQFFRQETESGADAVTEAVLIPVAASLTLDDTPEVLDPLEGDPVPVPGLVDGDLDTPTPIDLGDAAPPVREFGGDYRNLQIDLGEAEELSRAVLYVDERLLLPDLYEWRLFVSDDPAGREWRELLPSQFSIAYREFAGFRPGWEAVFAPSVAGRFFKMVDVKLGSTVPNLFVTELELYGREQTEESRAVEDSRTHRLDAGLAYDLTANIQVASQTGLRKRDFDEESQSLEEVDQVFLSSYRRGRFLLSGQYGIHRLWSETRRNTDVVDYALTARQGWRADLSTSLSWTWSRDESGDLDRTTRSLSLLTAWDPTRRLRVSQRVTRAELTDAGFLVDAEADRSTSVTLTTSVRSSPLVAFSLDLDRTDRWVGEEASTGFDRFNDTALTTTWSPVPLIVLSSRVAYQVREDEDWLVRNTASWTPFPGGRMEFRFSGSTFSDTRTDHTRYGAEAFVRWLLGARVTAEGSVETSRVELAGETTTPVSTQIHLLWTF